MHKRQLITNGSWGIVAHASQTVLVSLFFVIVARRYFTEEFAKFIVTTALVQMLSALSALGLGHWFIREMTHTQHREELLFKFLKMQGVSGAVFYLINVAVAFLLYDDSTIRLIAAIAGANIIFDNVVNALKCVNIADLQQRKSFAILTLDAFLRCAAGASLFIIPFSVVTLSVLLLVVRVFTLNLFLRIGTSGAVSLTRLLRQHHSTFADVRRIVIANWPWIVLGGVSMVNWRMASIIVSKQLSLADTAIYEICYRLFSPAQMLPVIVMSAVFPLLVRMHSAGDLREFRTLYRQAYAYNLLFGVLVYSAVYSFADVLIPLAFGARYATASIYAKQMFLTILVFPTAFLQGNVLLAMKLERRDMWLNVVLLALNGTICVAGLHYLPSLGVVNAALFLSFAIFHLLQDALLIQRGVSTLRHALSCHITAAACVLSYVLLAHAISAHLAFPVYWGCLLLAVMLVKKHAPLRRRANLEWLAGTTVGKTHA